MTTLTKLQQNKLQQIIESSDGFLFAKDIFNTDIKALEQAVLENDEAKKVFESSAYAKKLEQQTQSA